MSKSLYYKLVELQIILDDIEPDIIKAGKLARQRLKSRSWKDARLGQSDFLNQASNYWKASKELEKVINQLKRNIYIGNLH